ncbi:hypothetical protein B0J15DRAFT_410447, partial [Fusarium solani]
GKATIGSALRLAIKSRFKQSDLNRLEKDLANVQSTMETQLLIGMRQRLDANLLHNDELDRDLKYFVRQLSDGRTNLSNLILKQSHELREVISKGFIGAERSTKAHITTELFHTEDRVRKGIARAVDNVQFIVERSAQVDKGSRQQEEAYRLLLGSLKFPEMEARRNQISHACPETFLWVLDPQDPRHDDDVNPDGEDGNFSNSPTWDSLVEWLQSSQPVYWISGKPASGKSTLMKFILSQNQTKLLLREWQENVRILSHFFWKPGTELQQSIKGFLCSVIHQIFVQDKDQAFSYLETRQELSLKSSPFDWDQVELQDLLIDYLQQASAAFCLFIDGLDEVWPKDGVENLTSLFGTLFRGCQRLKLCVSSRREHFLETRLRDYPQLRMHDLTRKDLQKYASQVLNQALAYSRSRLDAEFIRKLVAEIVSASQGVFLWAVLVSNSLSRGIQNDDSREELWQRLGSIPRDLEGLYLDMWLRQNEDHEIYQKSSAMLFCLSLLVFAGWKDKPRFGVNLTVFQLMAAMDDEILDDHLIHHRHYQFETVKEKCQATAKMIQIRSAGLLEVFQTTHYRSFVYPALHLGVRYIHRSAQDFLTDTDRGQAIWQKHGMSYDVAFTKLYRASILELCYPPKNARRFLASLLNSRLQELAHRRSFLGPSVIQYYLQATAGFWHHPSVAVLDPIPGKGPVYSIRQFKFLLQASSFGFLSYVSEQLSTEENDPSVLPGFLLHSFRGQDWLGWSHSAPEWAQPDLIVDAQCRLLRLLLNKISVPETGPLILLPGGHSDPCRNLPGTLGWFLLLTRNCLAKVTGSSLAAQAFLDTLDAFVDTIFDLNVQLLLDVCSPHQGSVAQFQLPIGIVAQTHGSERMQIEISLRNWVDATRDGLRARISGNYSTFGDKPCTPHVRLVGSYGFENEAACRSPPPNEKDLCLLSNLVQELLYYPLWHRPTDPSLPSSADAPPESYQCFFDTVHSLGAGRTKSVEKREKPLERQGRNTSYPIVLLYNSNSSI